ncbi:MAG: Ig-like domain-containing protein, partial [Sphingobacteriales bacterium]
MLRNLLYILGLFLIIGTSFRCGQPLPPTGGMKDTIPPNLIRALPKDSATNTIAKKIILEFDEYVQLQEVQQQLVVSPVPKIQPLIESKLRTVTISIKDTLQDNTTYSFNFGNSLQDINENNPLKNFTYVFSTGSSIDSGNISGQILIAETGKPDSTILAILHPDLSDTAVV